MGAHDLDIEPEAPATLLQAPLPVPPLLPLSHHGGRGCGGRRPLGLREMPLPAEAALVVLHVMGDGSLKRSLPVIKGLLRLSPNREVFSDKPAAAHHGRILLAALKLQLRRKSPGTPLTYWRLDWSDWHDDVDHGSQFDGHGWAESV